MKILKSLNKKILSIFIILFLSFLNNLRAEDEPVDIWDLEKKLEDNPSNEVIDISEDTNELEITPTYDVDISDMRMQWLVSCTTGIVRDPKNREEICKEIKPYTLTLISEFQDGKYLVDDMYNETLDSEEALNKLEEFLK